MNYSYLNFSNNSLFLVTGGAGFIGSNLCEAILKMGHKVRCLDNLSTGKDNNVDIFLNNPNYTFIKGDIKDLDICMKACDGVDYVLHQAALSSVPGSIERPLQYCASNITGTLNMLEAAKFSNVKKFVDASSASVYGDEPSDVKVEGKEGHLLSPYAVSKRCNEEWAKQYTVYYGLDTYGLRYFNVYGMRQNPHSEYSAVIPNFIKQLLIGEPPTIYGDGEQSRDFVYVKDVVQANLLACSASHKSSGNVFNVAYGAGLSILSLYGLLQKLLNISIQPTFAPARKGDIKHSVANISQIKRILHYIPSYDFINGLSETISWYRSQL